MISPSFSFLYRSVQDCFSLTASRVDFGTERKLKGTYGALPDSPLEKNGHSAFRKSVFFSNVHQIFLHFVYIAFLSVLSPKTMKFAKFLRRCTHFMEVYYM